MIIKVIPAKPKQKGVERYARYLANYMASADRQWLQPDAIGMDYGLTLSAYMSSALEDSGDPQERVLHRGAFVGGEGRTWEVVEAEVQTVLKKRSRKVKKPVRHVIMSCRSGEALDDQGCAEAVMTVANELGCENAAILWAAHGDTDNFHLHIMFVTVDPDSGTALPFGQEPDGRAGYKEAMQRAIARIEHAQQLQPEAAARYQLVDEKVVRNPKPVEPKSVERKRTPIRQEILAWEEQSGFASFTRYAQEVAGPVLDDATSWTELHAQLAPHGLGLRAFGNGGEVYADGEHVKLSNIDRRHTWIKLKNRWGAFEEAGAPDRPYQPRILDAAKADRWLQRDRQLREINHRIDQRIAQLLAARDAALDHANEQLSAYRVDLGRLGGDPRLQRDVANAWPRLRASATAAIHAAFSSRIEAVRGLRHAAAETADLDTVDAEAIGAPDVGIVAPWHCAPSSHDVTALEGFDAERCGDLVRYWSRSDAVRKGQPSLVDAGAIIWVNDRSDQAIEAALLLARTRFGAVAVFGDAAYLRQCDKAAKRLGITLETITVSEARRRAKKADNVRNEARRHAVERHQGWASPVERLRHWAHAFDRATPVDDMAQFLGEAQRLAAAAHHSAIQSPDAKLGREQTPHRRVSANTSAQIEMKAAAAQAGGQDR